MLRTVATSQQAENILIAGERERGRQAGGQIEAAWLGQLNWRF